MCNKQLVYVFYEIICASASYIYIWLELTKFSIPMNIIDNVRETNLILCMAHSGTVNY